MSSDRFTQKRVIEFTGPAADSWRASLILQREGLMDQPPEITPGYPILDTDRTEETFLGINRVLDKIQRRTAEDVPFTPVTDDDDLADDTECRVCGCDLSGHLNDECGPGCGECGDCDGYI